MISFRGYRNADYVRLLTQVLLICKAYSAEVLQAIGLASYYQDLLAREPQIGLALDKNNKNPFTVPVADADQDRDDALYAFKYFLQYCSKQPDPVIRAAAERLIAVMQTIGWSMEKDNYSEESKNVRSLVAELESRASLSGDVAICSATAEFDRIKTTQARFEELLAEFNKAETQQKDVDPVAEKEWLRTTLDNLLYDLEYHCRKQTNAECVEIRNQLETVLASISIEIKARIARNEEEPQTEV